MNRVKFTHDPEERGLIRAIAKRACEVQAAAGYPLPQMEVEMDLAALHASSQPLRLADLLAADDFNLIHDIIGIRLHLNRNTGQLDGHFLPRYADTERQP